MRKNFRLKLIITSLIILLPMFAGLVFWNKIPPLMATHWGLDGQANGWSGRGMTVFGLPLILLASHWLCLFITLKLDPKNKDMNGKPLELMLWVLPLISLFVSGIVWSSAFGMELPISVFTSGLFGLMFIIIGNYLPKCRQNYTLGIKVPWTLNNEENWNATHRFGGKVWAIGGVAMLFGAFLPESIMVWLLLGAALVLAFVPMIYSYLYYKKQLVAGTASKEDASFIPRGLSRKTGYISLVVVVMILALTAIMMFTGNIDYSFGEDSFTVKADFYSDLTVEYAAIESLEYLDCNPSAFRVLGFGSGRLQMGMYQNSDLGQHSRYCYTACPAAVKLSVEGKTLVLSGPGVGETRQLYENLLILTNR